MRWLWFRVLAYLGLRPVHLAQAMVIVQRANVARAAQPNAVLTIDRNVRERKDWCSVSSVQLDQKKRPIGRPLNKPTGRTTDPLTNNGSSSFPPPYIFVINK
jgi:hypothetical protein